MGLGFPGRLEGFDGGAGQSGCWECGASPFPKWIHQAFDHLCESCTILPLAGWFVQGFPHEAGLVSCNLPLRCRSSVF